MRTIFTSLLWFVFANPTLGVDIFEADLLAPLEFGSRNEIVLNCDYELSDEEKPQLDIKWYFNDDVTPFLQWVPGGGRKPQLIPGTHFKGHVDLDFRVDEDEYKAYRALRIVEPTLAMSGDYRCKVSTFEDEGYVEQKLLLYVPPKNVLLHHQFDSNEGNLDVTCLVQQVFPEPIVKLLWNDSILDSAQQYNTGLDNEQEEGSGGEGEESGLFDIRLRYQQKIVEHETVELGCKMELPLPQVDISVMKKLHVELADYYDESGSGECQDDCSGSGSGTQDEAENEEKYQEGDYDNDWLNIYNDTADVTEAYGSGSGDWQDADDERTENDVLSNEGDRNEKADSEGAANACIARFISLVISLMVVFLLR